MIPFVTFASALSLYRVPLHEGVTVAFRCQAVLDRDLFTALHASEEGLRDIAKEAFGIDVSLGFAHIF